MKNWKIRNQNKRNILLNGEQNDYDDEKSSNNHPESAVSLVPSEQSCDVFRVAVQSTSAVLCHVRDCINDD